MFQNTKYKFTVYADYINSGFEEIGCLDRAHAKFSIPALIFLQSEV